MEEKSSKRLLSQRVPRQLRGEQRQAYEDGLGVAWLNDILGHVGCARYSAGV